MICTQGMPGCKNVRRGGDSVKTNNAAGACMCYIVYRSFKIAPHHVSKGWCFTGFTWNNSCSLAEVKKWNETCIAICLYRDPRSKYIPYNIRIIEFAATLNPNIAHLAVTSASCSWSGIRVKSCFRYASCDYSPMLRPHLGGPPSALQKAWWKTLAKVQPGLLQVWQN